MTLCSVFVMTNPVHVGVWGWADVGLWGCGQGLSGMWPGWYVGMYSEMSVPSDIIFSRLISKHVPSNSQYIAGAYVCI